MRRRRTDDQSGEDVAVIAQWNGPMVMLAAEHSGGRPTAGGIETLVIGLVLFAFGSPAAAEFRRGLERWDRTPEPVLTLLRRIPLWRGEPSDKRTQARIATAVFAVVGLLCIPVGSYRIATGKL
jgi:hypothetical protein